MRGTTRVRVLAGCWLVLGAVAAYAQPAPLGDEVALDPQADNDFCPALAAHGDGSFAVGWLRNTVSGSKVMLRASDGAGNLGPARTLDGDHTGQAQVDGLAATANGYEAMWQKPTPPNHYPHLVQQLDANGASLGTPVTLARHFVPMSPRPVGGVVSVWTSGKQLDVQRLGSDGTPLGPPARVRTRASFAQVLHRPSGEFVVMWQVGGFGGAYLAQRFSAGGALVGKPFTTVPAAPAASVRIAIAALGSDGTLAVASSVELPVSIEDEQVTLRIYDAAGHLIAGPVPITTHVDAATAQSAPRTLAVDDRGRVMLVWSWEEDVEEPHARARVFARDGSPVGDFFDPASDASRGDFPSFYCAAVSWNGTDWVLAWSGWTSPIDDDDGHSQIWVRRFGG